MACRTAPGPTSGEMRSKKLDLGARRAAGGKRREGRRRSHRGQTTGRLAQIPTPDHGGSPACAPQLVTIAPIATLADDYGMDTAQISLICREFRQRDDFGVGRFEGSYEAIKGLPSAAQARWPAPASASRKTARRRVSNARRARSARRRTPRWLRRPGAAHAGERQEPVDEPLRRSVGARRKVKPQAALEVGLHLRARENGPSTACGRRACARKGKFSRARGRRK